MKLDDGNVDPPPIEGDLNEGETGDGGNYASIPFSLDSGEYRFAPSIYPDTLRVSKERNLNRKDNFCGGEDVSDQGGKNKEIHISGHVQEQWKDDVWDIVDYSQKLELVSKTWSGEVRVETAELEGPLGLNPETQEPYWKYTLDLVSTGEDEPGGSSDDSGVISDGQ